MSSRQRDLERMQRNRDLLRRMESGANLSLMSPEQTFFPPRPLIKKDKEIIQALYGKEPPKKK